MPKILEYREINLSDLVIGKAQVRTANVNQGIEELADNIARVGLLHPIVVCPTSKAGKYEILLGQRRFLAHQELQRKKIMCAVFDVSVDPITAKVISLSENAVREGLDRKDMIDVCTALFKHYGSIKDVVEKTGISESKVRQFVKYEQLTPELKDMVDTGEVKLAAALKALQASSVGGTVNKDEAVTLAKAMTSMSGFNQKRIVEEKIKAPEKTATDLIKESQKGYEATSIMVILSGRAHKALQAFARDEGTNQGDAAAALIEEGLEGKGFFNDDDFLEDEDA